LLKKLGIKNKSRKNVKIMVETNLEITNETGLHARPASKFVQKASSFKSDVKVKMSRLLWKNWLIF